MNQANGQPQSPDSPLAAAGLAGFDPTAIRAMMDADRVAAEVSIAAATETFPSSLVPPDAEEVATTNATTSPAPSAASHPSTASPFSPAASAVPADAASTTSAPASPADSVAPVSPDARPIRSAKDAINAMYAASPDTRLSSYLASTAKEIINASAAAGGEKPSLNAKSASSLHHKSGQRKMESTRPSASALFRMAKSKSERTPPPRPTTNSADPLLETDAPVVTKRSSSKENSQVVPVVRTSLKLAPKPKKPPVVIQPKTIARSPSRSIDGASRANQNGGLRPAKGKIAVRAAAGNTTATAAASSSAKSAVHAASSASVDTALTVAFIQKATAAALKVNQPPVLKPKASRPAKAGRMMDVAPRPSQGLMSAPSHSSPSASRLPREEQNIYTQRASKSVAKPFRSVKERFRPAPRGFSAARPSQARAEVFADFSNPDHPIKAQHLSLPAPSSVDIYAENDTTVPAAKVQSKKNAEVGLGVVRDYRPAGDRIENSHFTETSVADGHGAAAPDNNRYALGGQSPFFLKTVQVEKRPLSDGPKRSQTTSAGTVYAAPQFEDKKGKNGYDKKSAKKAKTKTKAKPAKSPKKPLRQDIPTRPTVIVPPSRRSHAPLFFLLLFTIILGAAVGALSYLCFFQ